MAFIQFSKVSLAFGDRDILKNVSVNLATGTKAALTGANGAGKSTLIKIMAGLVEPDSGERVSQKDARIAYLPQSGLVHSGCTLKEEADKAFEWGYEIQRKADELGEQLASNPANAEKLAVEHSELLAKLEESGWYRREVLEGLLGPFEEGVPLLVPLEIELLVEFERIVPSGEVGVDGVVDDQVDGDQGVDELRVLAHGLDGVPHGCQVGDGGSSGEVLQ